MRIWSIGLEVSYCGLPKTLAAVARGSKAGLRYWKSGALPPYDAAGLGGTVLAWEAFVAMGVRLFVSTRIRGSAGPLRMRNGMLRPSVGVEGPEDDSSATSFSAAGITNSLSEKACIDEIGRAKPGRVPATPFDSLGNSVPDV